MKSPTLVFCSLCLPLSNAGGHIDLKMLDIGLYCTGFNARGIVL